MLVRTGPASAASLITKLMNVIIKVSALIFYHYLSFRLEKGDKLMQTAVCV